MKLKPTIEQKKAIKNASIYFKKNDRGTLIMACGTGKTFTAQQIDEALKTQLTVVLLPSLSLLNQFQGVWHKQSSKKFISKVYSSEVPAFKGKELKDEPLSKFAKRLDKKVIFCTYQSIKKLLEELNELKLTVDFTVCDEAHRTSVNRDGKLFNLAHEIPTEKILYMTATKKVYAKEEGKEDNSFCMSNEDIFGQTFYTLPFYSAIEKNLLCQTKLKVFGVDNYLSNISIHNTKVIKGKGYKVSSLAHAYVLREILKKKEAKKIMVFSLTRKTVKEIKAAFDEISKTPSFYVEGDMKGLKREVVLDGFKNLSEAVIFNSKCLIEGIDDPTTDSVYFVEDKKSKIDTIQAASRALRKDPKNKLKNAKIFFPVAQMGTEKDADKFADSQNHSAMLTLMQELIGEDKFSFLVGEYLKNTETKSSRESDKELEELIKKLGLELSDVSLDIKKIIIKNIAIKMKPWEDMLKLCQEYIKQYPASPYGSTSSLSEGVKGHIQTTTTFHGLNVGSWFARQRKLYRSKTLPTQRMKLIKDSGLCLSPKFQKAYQEALENTRDPSFLESYDYVKKVQEEDFDTSVNLKKEYSKAFKSYLKSIDNADPNDHFLIKSFAGYINKEEFSFISDDLSDIKNKLKELKSQFTPMSKEVKKFLIKNKILNNYYSGHSFFHLKDRLFSIEDTDYSPVKMFSSFHEFIEDKVWEKVQSTGDKIFTGKIFKCYSFGSSLSGTDSDMIVVFKKQNAYYFLYNPKTKQYQSEVMVSHKNDLQIISLAQGLQNVASIEKSAEEKDKKSA